MQLQVHFWCSRGVLLSRRPLRTTFIQSFGDQGVQDYLTITGRCVGVGTEELQYTCLFFFFQVSLLELDLGLRP